MLENSQTFHFSPANQKWIFESIFETLINSTNHGSVRYNLAVEN